MKKSFETMLQVRFGHVDPAGIVYFPRIFDYVHDVFEELFEQHVGHRYYHVLQERRFGMPLVHSDVDFEKPLRFGDRPLVRVTCFHLGRSSVGLRYRFFVDLEPRLEARMTVVATDLEQMAPVPVPDEFRRAFEALLETPDPDSP